MMFAIWWMRFAVRDSRGGRWPGCAASTCSADWVSDMTGLLIVDSGPAPNAVFRSGRLGGDGPGRRNRTPRSHMSGEGNAVWEQKTGDGVHGRSRRRKAAAAHLELRGRADLRLRVVRAHRPKRA